MSPFTSATERWRACYDQLAPRLLLFARQWLTSTADAEDAVQAGFVRFWRRKPDAGEADYPLLYSAVRSAALDLIRKDARRSRRESAYQDEEPGGEPVFFDPSPEQRERTQLLEQAMERLPAAQREVLVLHIWGELTFAQIATALEESINTVSARYRYGLEALRKHFTPRIHEPV